MKAAAHFPFRREETFAIIFDPFANGVPYPRLGKREARSLQDEIQLHIDDVIEQIQEGAMHLGMSNFQIELMDHEDFPRTLSAMVMVSGTVELIDDLDAQELMIMLRHNVQTVLEHAVLLID